MSQASEPDRAADPHRDMHAETELLHADSDLRSDSALVPPIHYSATFVAADADAFADMASRSRHSRYYTRYGNPLHERVGRILARLEGTETALVMGSGMGAIATTVIALLRAGDHVVVQGRHYMSTTKLFDELLPRYGVAVSVVEQADTGAFERALRPETRLVMLETPANPTLVLTDLAAVAALARPRGILTLADNTFASPLNQRPHALGVDIVVHSGTKYLGGHHDLTAGVVCCSTALAERIWETHITLGSVLSPMDAWLLLRGLRTLAVRMRQACTSAAQIARWLAAHPRVSNVYYPGLPADAGHEAATRLFGGEHYGSMLAFEVAGLDRAGAFRLMESLRLIKPVTSLGDVYSIVLHPASASHRALTPEQREAQGITEGVLRLSVGIESPDDLIADLEQALAAAAPAG